MSIAVVIPCFRVSSTLDKVLISIGAEVDFVIVVDDLCPEGSGKIAEKRAKHDQRIHVIYHERNQGVGGAVVSGYKRALALGAEIVVKVDGDGQMDPALIPDLVEPLVFGEADYAKGNRFDTLEDLIEMPKIRIFGNAALSIMSKLSTGYWRVNDPTNGFTAIHRDALKRIRLDKVRKNYFFESDMLFRLSISRAKVVDYSMRARYGEEKSNLRIRRVLWEFPLRHSINFLKRLLYKYYLREWSIASFELPIGLLLSLFGVFFGLSSFFEASSAGRATTAGQATIAAVAIILGIQLLLSFLAYDIQSEPNRAIRRRG
jgi:dolichol-phosphate mannosyltransferase